MLPVAPAKPAPPTEAYVYKLWGAVFVASVVATLVGANASGAKVAAMVSATVCSFLVGSLPDIKAKMNPIVTTAVLTNVAAAALGALTGDGWMKMLSLYRTGVPFGLETIGGLGAGDILMTFLGSVILSFAFKVFEARKIIVRHAVEIFGCLISTSLFGMFSTAIAGKYLGLSAALSAALVPRSVTVALAIPVTTLLGHPEMVPVTAAGVVLTGLIGSSLCVPILNKIGAKDPITRGMATAASAHGLGTRRRRTASITFRGFGVRAFWYPRERHRGDPIHSIRAHRYHRLSNVFGFNIISCLITTFHYGYASYFCTKACCVFRYRITSRGGCSVAAPCF
jgi:hypothetical protein